MLIDSIINSLFNILFDILITWAFALTHAFDADFDYKSHPIVADRRTL